jgi:hypothetical protein
MVARAAAVIRQADSYQICDHGKANSSSSSSRSSGLDVGQNQQMGEGLFLG